MRRIRRMRTVFHQSTPLKPQSKRIVKRGLTPEKAKLIGRMLLRIFDRILPIILEILNRFW